MNGQQAVHAYGALACGVQTRCTVNETLSCWGGFGGGRTRLDGFAEATTHRRPGDTDRDSVRPQDWNTMGVSAA